MDKDTNYYWNEIYSKNINTAWGQSDPDPKMREIVLGILGNFPKKSVNVLDIGCGNGRNSKIFNEVGNFEIKYVGIDFARSAIDYCNRTYPGRTFIQHDITENLDLPAEYFNLIIDHGCFHCIKPVDRIKYVANIVKLTTPGSFLIIDAWYGDGKPVGEEPDFRPYYVLNEWFVNINSIESLFPVFELQNYFIDKNTPHNVHNGLIYFIMFRK